MGIAKTRRIADRVHRGQLFAGGELFVAHLQRVAESVAALGGGPVAIEAAWLYAAPAAGTGPADLLRQGIRVQVVEIVEVLRPRPYEYPPTIPDRILHHPRAALVWYAVLRDRNDNGAGRPSDEQARAQHERLADALGLPQPLASTPSPDDVVSLVRNLPAHARGRCPIASLAEQVRDPRILPTLVDA
jgi:hypothetical protein